MLLTRTNDGKILDGGRPVLLRGGHCHVFSEGIGDRSLSRGGQPFSVTFPATGPQANGCAASRPETGLTVASWGNYVDFLNALRAAQCNLTRVFLSNGAVVEPTPGQPARPLVKTLHPFTRTPTGRWRIAAAIRDNAPESWNEDYFTTLRSFTRAADQRGIAVQLCLFSYHDFTPDPLPTFRYWGLNCWNAKNADHQDWAATHLVPTSVGTDPQKLNHYFFDTANIDLMASQRAYVERVLSAICPGGNVIIELMNEPRVGLAGGQHYMASWLDQVTRWIVEWLNRRQISPRPLISANASYPLGGALPATPDGPPGSDVDAWLADRGLLQAYAALDLISYHGLTGLADAPSGCGQAKQTDLPTIKARIDRHKSLHSGKAMMFSTDALRTGPQTFPQNVPRLEIHRRDGHVRTEVPYGAALDPFQQRTRNDLDNWAYHTFKAGLAPIDAGRIHFQNHSTFELSFDLIRRAYGAAGGSPAAAP
jgi:hypothetical protein